MVSDVYGYTSANDVTARDIQRQENLPDFAKSIDTFCPLGPWIDTELDLTHATVQCLVNGEPRQHGRISDLLTPIPELIAHSTSVGHDPGARGRHADRHSGRGRLFPGDRAEVSITGLGPLINPVVDGEPRYLAV